MDVPATVKLSDRPALYESLRHLNSRLSSAPQTHDSRVFRFHSEPFALNRAMHKNYARSIVLALAFWAGLAHAAHLPGTEPLTTTGDLSAQMVAGIDRYLTERTGVTVGQRAEFWKRDFSSPGAYETSTTTNRSWLKRIIGAADTRPTVAELQLVETTRQSSKLAETAKYSIFAIRWPALDNTHRIHGEGLWLKPKGKAAAVVICVPDADQTPEMLCGLEPGMSQETQFARLLAENGFEVFIPVLINRSDTFSGNPELNRFTNFPHREWIYRQAYETGQHIIGYEVQKVLALVDWLERRGEKKIGVAGYAEGGLIAFYAAAIDSRISATLVSGYFGPREQLWQEPIYRNVFTLLERFGDAEIASLIAPRVLIVEHSVVPEVNGPPAARQGRSGAAPGKLVTPERHEVESELNRARELFPQSFKVDFNFVHGQEGNPVGPGSPKALGLLAEKLGGKFDLRLQSSPPNPDGKGIDSQDRQRRQIQEMVDFTQHQAIRTERGRNDQFWKEVSKLKADQWKEQRIPFRDSFWSGLIGRLPDPQKAINPRSRQIYDEAKWVGYDVVLEVQTNVFAWGILCIPKDLKPDEKRPVVVCQHGLEGVPADTISGPGSSGYGPYKAFTARLAERGFITFAPHNPYRGQDKFRVLQRKANPIGKSLFSVIIIQHEQILNWIEQLPFVDPQRIGFYGLSYGGKTAMRVPSVLDRYALSICSADFNEWVKKNTTVHSGYSYMYTVEHDMLEFGLARNWNYAEMAALVAPRPFMVERGHDDGVAPDEWVAYEFAKVRRFYNKLGIGDRAQIEFFDGPHTINGVETFRFLHRHLNWPEPPAN